MHSNIFLILLCCCLSVSALLSPIAIHPEKIYQNVSPKEPRISSLEDAIQQTEKVILQYKEAYGMPSVVFSITVKGSKLWEKAWGLADIENAIPAQTDTHYRIASISKTFTSVLIGSLVDQGLLSYDDPLSKYLVKSQYPPKTWKGIPVDLTIGNLLSNTGGNHETSDADLNNLVHDVRSVKQMIGKFKDEPLKCKPGEQFYYSNYGFQLLGAVIETITGKQFPQVMIELFAQIGLNSSYVETYESVVANRAQYYRYTDAKRIQENVPTSMFDQLVAEEGWWPAGGLVSTVGDLVKYGNVLLDIYKGKQGKRDLILSNKTIEQMWTPRTEDIDNFPLRPVNEYGYGWFIAHVSETVNPNLKYRDFVWHSGGLHGLSSFLIIYPEQEIVVAVITNKGSVEGLDVMAMTAAELMYDIPMKNLSLRNDFNLIVLLFILLQILHTFKCIL